MTQPVLEFAGVEIIWGGGVGVEDDDGCWGDKCGGGGGCWI